MLAQQIVNGLMLGGIYVLVAVSFTLAIGVLNFLNFSLPAVFMFCGMFAWSLVDTGVPWWLVAIGTIIAGIGISFLVERVTYRWMRSSDPFVPLVSSMAILTLIQNLVLIRWGSDIEIVRPPYTVDMLHVANLLLSVPQSVGLVLSILLVCALVAFLDRTQIGRGLRAISENADTAAILGVSVARLVPAVFIASGFLTAIAALIFVVNYHQARFDMGEAVALKGISAMVVGGVGSIWGAVVGGLLLGVVEVIAIWRFGADFGGVAVYGLLVVILILCPSGLFGRAAMTRRF